MNSKIQEIGVKTLILNIEILLLEGIILQNTLSLETKLKQMNFVVVNVLYHLNVIYFFKNLFDTEHKQG